MAKKVVVLERDLGGFKEIKEAPVGFSWTVFFFGPIPPLFRKDWKWAGIIAALNMAFMGLANIPMAFLYNKFYLKDLLKEGFKVKLIKGMTLDQLKAYVGMPLETTEDFKEYPF